MTRKQLELFEYLKTYIADHEGVSPSFEEIQAHLGLAPKSGVHRLVTALVERGMIRRLTHRARAIEIITGPQQTVVPFGRLDTERLIKAVLKAHAEEIEPGEPPTIICTEAELRATVAAALG